MPSLGGIPYHRKPLCGNKKEHNMKKEIFKAIPNQVKIINSIDNIPVEYFKWGVYPDHFKIDMPHRHEFAELLFFTKGGGWHEIDCINYDVHENSIHFIPKSTVHFFSEEKNNLMVLPLPLILNILKIMPIINL